MTFVEFEHRVLPRIVLPLIGALALLAIAGRHQVQAATNSFVISDTEGYGITECLTNGSACGRVVADAWCEAHGYGQSLAFGRADDVTGSTAAKGADPKIETVATQVRPNSIIVTCDK